jgi:hypothetical protein
MVFPFYGHTAHLSYDGDFKLGALILKSWRISLWQSWLTPRRMINRCNANWTCCIICRHLDLPTPWSTHDVGLLNYAEHREVLKSPPQVQFLGCSIKKCTVLYIASIPFSHQHRFMSSINITLHHTHTHVRCDSNLKVPDHAAEICCSKLQSSHSERRWWMRDRPGVFHPPSDRSNHLAFVTANIWNLIIGTRQIFDALLHSNGL